MKFDIIDVVEAMRYVGCSELMAYEIKYVMETCENGLCQNHCANGGYDVNSCCVCSKNRLEFGDY